MNRSPISLTDHQLARSKLLDQFIKSPQEMFSRDSDQVQHLAYKNIFDQIESRKTKLTNQIKKYKNMIGMKEIFEQTKQKNNTEVSSIFNGTSRINEDQSNFYLTGVNNHKQTSALRIKTAQSRYRQDISKYNSQKMPTEQAKDEETLTITPTQTMIQTESQLNLVAGQITFQENVKNTLEHQILLTKESISHFKKQIFLLQENIHHYTEKSIQTNQALQNISKEFVNSKKIKEEARSIIHKTTHRFNTAFDNKRRILNKSSALNQKKVDDLAQKNIAFLNLNQKIKDQKKELMILQMQKAQLSNKSNEQNRLNNSHQQIINTFIYMQMLKLSNECLIDQLYYSQKLIERINFQKQNNPDLQRLRYLEQLSNQIIKYYQILTRREQDLKNEYMIIMEEKSDKEELCNKLFNYKGPHQSTTCNLIQQSTLIQQEDPQPLNSLKIKKCIVDFSCRLAGNLNRIVYILKQIISGWLANDAEANQFINKALGDGLFCFYGEYHANHSLARKEFKHLLSKHFQNHQNYEIYIENIIQNEVILKNITIQSFELFLKKIVKTKINHLNYSTKKLFQVGILDLFQNCLKQQQKIIEFLFGEYASFQKFCYQSCRLNLNLKNLTYDQKDQSRQALKNVIKSTKGQTGQIILGQQVTKRQPEFTLAQIGKWKKNNKIKHRKIDQELDSGLFYQQFQDQLNKIEAIAYNV